MIGALVGGGEDLAFVDYAPGSSGPPTAAEQQDKLAKVAKALVDRPALKLDIAGRVDPGADVEALRRRALVRKLAALREDAVTTPEAMTIPPAEFAALLKRAFDSDPQARAAAGIRPAPAPLSATPTATATTTPREAATPAASPVAGASAAAAPATEVPAAEMERALLARIDITPDDLRELAERRANATKNALALLGVPGERMFIVASAPMPAAGDAKKRAPGVDFVLK